MTLYRKISTPVDAVQFQETETDAEQLVFNETPDWLQTAFDTGAVTRHAGDLDGTVNATVNAQYGPILAAPTDWIVRGESDALRVIPDAYFQATYEAVGETTAAPAAAPAAASTADTTTGAA